MRTILSAGVLAVLLLVCAGAAPEGEWNVTFGGTDCDYAQSVQQTADGGYILAGYTTSYGAGSSDMWLVKVDVGGNEQWNKTFGGTGEEQAKSIQQTSDGGYVLAGSTSWNARLKLSTAAQIRGDLNSDC
ncbi:MAG: hypothetical protein U9N09_01755, partial [Euryarchaeota archaeon]|nr:hypothetical protein [Euryarchaeota archaeon]